MQKKWNRCITLFLKIFFYAICYCILASSLPYVINSMQKYILPLLPRDIELHQFYHSERIYDEIKLVFDVKYYRYANIF